MKTLNKLSQVIKKHIDKSKNLEELNVIRVRYLGRRGTLTIKMKHLRNVSFEEKKKYSLMINEIKKEALIQINEKRNQLNKIILNKRIQKEKIDISLPGRCIEHGIFHPIMKTIDDIKKFFFRLGFQSVNGPEIEDEYHNFDALNIPHNHPSRNNHDTFWFNKHSLLRTQTSNMQIRIMKKETPPIRLIFPGKVYRNDYDTTHTPMFHQVEGLIVDKNVNFSNLKWIIYNFLYNFFGKDISIKFRPSYFPFTVPSAEVDIISRDGKSLEILGCGMVHPKVLKNVNINSNIYSACAFGIGIERIAMLHYDISDIRSFFENDIRFLNQFKYN